MDILANIFPGIENDLKKSIHGLTYQTGFMAKLEVTYEFVQNVVIGLKMIFNLITSYDVRSNHRQ